jgi:transposase
VVVRKGTRGKFVNPVLYEYYQRKIQSKANKQALGAIMNKLIRIIYSVLKNSKPFEIITPKEQEERYKRFSKSAA